MFAPARCRLVVDCAALQKNYLRLAQMSGAARTGAAVKANAYGVGVGVAVRALAQVGAQDFFVATLREAQEVRSLLPEARIYILNGILPHECAEVLALNALPVLCTPAQIALWQPTRAPCVVMVDTGIHRLGLSLALWQALDISSLTMVGLFSHLACGDSPNSPLNARQQADVASLKAQNPKLCLSLANSAGIALGADYHFDMTRPGLALYGGQPWRAAIPGLAPVVQLEAQVIQIADIVPGDGVGYGSTWVAGSPARIATLNVGYGDGYLRSFSNRGQVAFGTDLAPVVGLVSMDLLTVDITHLPQIQVGDWATLLGGPLSLWQVAQLAGLTQYELLTLAGSRYDRFVAGQVPHN
jgi:alanine racemase